MTAQHKAFADYEVLTAADVNNYLMNQVMVKVLNTTERDALPTSVKQAYNTATGDVYIRDSSNVWLTHHATMQTYTPTWTASTTNPAIGNGTIVGRWIQRGNLVTFSATINMGSTTTYGSGLWSIGLPVATANITGFRQTFSAVLEDLSAGRHTATAYAEPNSTSVTRIIAGAATSGVSNTSPFTWANTDWIAVSGTYMV